MNEIIELLGNTFTYSSNHSTAYMRKGGGWGVVVEQKMISCYEGTLVPFNYPSDSIKHDSHCKTIV